jgi:hypothetical protein
VRIGLDQAARRARQVGVVEPGVAGEAGHEDDEVGGELAAFGLHLVGLEAGQLVAEVGGDVAPLHFRHQALHGLLAEAVAGVRHGIEEHQPDPVAPPLAPQLGIEAEEEFEHRPAAHGHRFVRVAGEAERDGAVLQGRTRSRRRSTAAMPSQGRMACSMPGSFLMKRPPQAMTRPSLCTGPAVVSTVRPPCSSPVASPATKRCAAPEEISRGMRRSSGLRLPEGSQIRLGRKSAPAAAR